MKVVPCPCCNHPIIDEDEALIVLKKTQRTIYQMVKNAGIAGIVTEALHERVYAYREDAPVTLNAISVTVAHINKKLKPLGLKIQCGKGQGNYGYRLYQLF